MPRRQTVGVFWEVYNALNKVNFGNPTGNRNNANFMVPVDGRDDAVDAARREVYVLNQ